MATGSTGLLQCNGIETNQEIINERKSMRMEGMEKGSKERYAHAE